MIGFEDRQKAVLDKLVSPCRWGCSSSSQTLPERHYFDIAELEGKTVESYSDVKGEGAWCLAMFCEWEYTGSMRYHGSVNPEPMYAICTAAAFKDLIPKGIRYIAMTSSDNFRGGKMGDSGELGKILCENEIPILFDAGNNPLSVYYSKALLKLGPDILSYFTLQGSTLTYNKKFPSSQATLFPICKMAGYYEIYDIVKSHNLIPSETTRSAFSDIVDMLSYGRLSVRPPENILNEWNETAEIAEKWGRYISFHGNNVEDSTLKATTDLVTDMFAIWNSRLEEANIGFQGDLGNLERTRRLAELGKAFGIDSDIAALMEKVPLSDIICG